MTHLLTLGSHESLVRWQVGLVRPVLVLQNHPGLLEFSASRERRVIRHRGRQVDKDLRRESFPDGVQSGSANAMIKRQTNDINVCNFGISEDRD